MRHNFKIFWIRHLKKYSLFAKAKWMNLYKNLWTFTRKKQKALKKTYVKMKRRFFKKIIQERAFNNN